MVTRKKYLIVVRRQIGGDRQLNKQKYFTTIQNRQVAYITAGLQNLITNTTNLIVRTML